MQTTDLAPGTPVKITQGTHKGKKGNVGQGTGTGRNRGKIPVELGRFKEVYWVNPGFLEVVTTAPFGNVSEGHSIDSELNLIGSSESQINQVACGWHRGQTAYHAASDRLGTICDFELDQKSGITFPVVQWNDSAVERVAPEFLSCPLQFSNSDSDAPIPTDNPRKVWRCKEGFFLIENPNNQFLEHLIRCDTLPIQEQIELAQSRIGILESAIEEYRTAQSQQPPESTRWKGLEKSINDRLQEIETERQYIGHLSRPDAVPVAQDRHDSVNLSPLCEPPLVETTTTQTDGRLALSLICTDGGTQSRAGLNDTTVEEYAEAMDAGDSFPPVLVFHDGKRCYLADGFHRVAAARHLGWADIAVEIRSGSRRDAVLYSVGANSAHGLRRTNADKRRAVEMLLRDEEWSQWSDNVIARACGVSQPFVSKLRTELFPSYNRYKIERTVSRNGTTYTQTTSKIGKSSIKAELGNKAKELGLPTKDGQVLPDVERNHTSTADVDDRPFAQPSSIVEQLKQKDTTPPPVPYSENDVVIIRSMGNLELSRFDGRWGILTAVDEYTTNVSLNGEDRDLRVEPKYLSGIDPERWEDIKLMYKRIKALQECDLDLADDAVLEVLLRRTCFTERQKLLVERMEKDYGLSK